MLQVIARYTIAPGNEDEVLALLPRLAEASRGEPGNLSYEIFRSVDDPLELVLLERYVSPEALDVHRETEHFKELALGRVIPLLTSRVVETYEAE
jgi:quinol monooxygenase YgiN